MALNSRLTQNIDLQADGSTLIKALGSIQNTLNGIVGSAGKLSEELGKGGKAGEAGFNRQLKAMSVLIAQAQNLQKILDSQKNQKANGLFAGLDEQRMGKRGAAASRLAQDLTATSSAADVLEKRLAMLNKRFAELTASGRTIGQRDLSKQLKTEDALKQVRELSRSFDKLNSQSLRTRGTGAQTEDMKRLRAEIEKSNVELGKMGQNYRRTDFQPQINQIRALTEEYRKVLLAATAYDKLQPGRAQSATKTAVGILNQTDAQRLADIKRQSSQFQFPQGISQTVSQQGAESRLAENLQKRLRLLNMIQAAQDRGAPTRSVERLNEAYKKLGQTLGEDFKLLTQVNKEIASTPQARAAAARQQIKEVLFGDGGAGLATRIGFASVITTGVFAIINAVKDATKFVVDYEAALKQLQAISGSTDTQMKSLASSIGDVSRNSTFSVLEITKAATVIAQAGFSASETAGVLKSAVTLSTASGSDPTQSVEVLTSALGAFQLQASESGRVVDTLVTGLNKSKLSMDQMAAAIQYAGATANESGVRLEELTAVAASMANAGIRSGSTIGTGFRQLLVDLKTPTEDFKKELKDVGLTLADVDVKSLGFAQVVRNLAEAGFTAEAAYSSFETRAASAFLAFKGQIDVYDDLALAIARGGAAQAAQEKSMDSLSAQFTRLTNALSILASGFAGPLVNSLKLVTNVLATVIETFSDAYSIFKNATDALGGFGDVLQILSAMLVGGAIAGPLGAIVAGVIGLANAFSATSDEMDRLQTKTAESQGAFDSQKNTVDNLDSSITSLIDRQGVLRNNSVALQTETVTLSERFGDLYTYLGKATGGYDELLNAMLRYRGEAIKQQGLEAQTLKTNAEIELNAARKQLNDSKGGGFLLRGGANAAATGANVRPEERTATQNRIRGALESDSISTVTTVRNEVAKLNAADPNGPYRRVLEALEERLTLIKRIASLESQVKTAGTQIDIANAATTDTAESRNRYVIGATNLVNGVLAQTDKGNFSQVNPTIKRLENTIANSKKELAQLKKGTGEYIVLQNDISKVENQLSRLVRVRREKQEEDDKTRPDKVTTARKGTNLTGTQVKTELNKAFPGSNVYSEKPRSLETQQRLYNEYKAGRGPLAAKPGTSNHGSGHAIDMTPMKGVSMDQIVSYLEGLGLEVTERLNERDPKTGRYHWHFAWKPKTSSFQKQEENNLEQLRKAKAQASVGASTSKIQAIIAEGKAGSGGNAADLNSRLESALTEYASATLNNYDVSNPTDGLTGDALALQQQGRAELQAKVKADAERFRADLFRAVGDEITKTFDAAMSQIEAELDRKNYDAQNQVRTADSTVARAGSRLNKDRVGEGTNYFLDQQRYRAQLNADQQTVQNNDVANIERSFSINRLQSQANSMPEGEAKAAVMVKIREETEKLNVAMRTNAELQQTINDRTTEFVNKPLNERLRDSVAAWADNSGIMSDWSTTMENSVGPALDMLASNLTNVFAKIMEGSASIKSVLKSMITAIGQFVVQLIAKALALAAIKWFLKLIGVELIADPSGAGTVIQRIPGKLTGGEIKPKKMMTGGSTSPGYISQGVSNRDTVPILGARGEFMLRKAAVDSLGIDNVAAMNKYGARAMNKMSGAVPVPMSNNQEMNVYVVKPDEKPQLGPRDVVLAITDDLLQGGVTKQLVRRISQGG